MTWNNSITYESATFIKQFGIIDMSNFATNDSNLDWSMTLGLFLVSLTSLYCRSTDSQKSFTTLPSWAVANTISTLHPDVSFFFKSWYHCGAFLVWFFQQWSSLWLNFLQLHFTPLPLPLPLLFFNNSGWLAWLCHKPSSCHTHFPWS